MKNFFVYIQKGGRLGGLLQYNEGNLFLSFSSPFYQFQVDKKGQELGGFSKVDWSV